MIELLFKGIFSLINMLFSAMFGGLFSIITSAFPSLSVYFSYIMSFLEKGLSYAGTVMDLFLIPRAAVQLLFSFEVIMFSLYITITSISFIVKIYNKFKP